MTRGCNDSIKYGNIESNNLLAKTYQINPKNGIINKKDEKKINKSINNKKINKTTKNINEHILDTIILDKEIDFSKNNFTYSWDNMDFVTTFTKKYERGNNIYLTCSKRGPNSDKCPCKAKYEKNNNIIKIYESCVNNPEMHNQLNFGLFKEMFEQNNFTKVSMNLKLYQRYFVQCLFLEKKANTYIDCIDQFKSKFKDCKFQLTEENVRKIKSNVLGSTRDLDIEEVCNTLSNLNKDIKVKIFPIEITNNIEKS